MTNEIKSWQRWPGESTKQHAAFTRYLHTHQRTLLKTAKELASDQTPQKIRSKLTQIKKWSAENDWISRAAAFDEEQERIFQKEIHEKQRAMMQLQADTGRALIEIAQKRFAATKPEDLSVSEAIKLLDLGTKIERAILGKSDRVKDTEEPGYFSGPLFEELMNDSKAAKLMALLTERAKEIENYRK